VLNIQIVLKLVLFLLTFFICFFSIGSRAQALVVDADTAITSYQPQLKVLSWNIYLLPRLIRKVGQMERSKIIAERLNEADYDVIVFQEAFDKKARTALWDILKAVYPYAIGPVNENVKKAMTVTNGGVWIVSKHPLTQIGEIMFDDCKGFDCGSRKGALMVEVQKDGITYQVVGTHMQADDSPKKEDIRNKQLMQIKTELVDVYHADGKPQLLCGDFNIHKRDLKHYNQMLVTLAANADNVCSPDLIEDNPGVSEDVYTYDCNSNDLVEYEESTTLDYILVKNNSISFSSIRRKVTTFIGSWTSKKLKNRNNLSDHHAVEIVLVPGI
jgi:endonuclease/exonuclease/phosphatase family metal-dependent hydrolase